MNILGAEGKRLLRVLVGEIKSGRVKAGEPRTFVPYSEALAALGHEKTHFRAGPRAILKPIQPIAM